MVITGTKLLYDRYSVIVEPMVADASEKIVKVLLTNCSPQAIVLPSQMTVGVVEEAGGIEDIELSVEDCQQILQVSCLPSPEDLDEPPAYAAVDPQHCSIQIGGIRDEEQESPEPMPSSHSIPSKATGNNSVCTHDLENLKEKPPDGDKEEEAMDSSQARKRPAPCNDETTGSAVQAPESVPSSAQRVPSPGDGVPRRFCQRSKESAIKKCKGSKTTDLPVAKGDEEQKL
ncbi:hypothetical protein HPB49_026034 [Dermacentor silvarum]|nr:hypothetical protein HPB49_026034 [Dermacentor silvarum]